jgi:hypothetical protein
MKDGPEVLVVKDSLHNSVCGRNHTTRTSVNNDFGDTYPQQYETRQSTHYVMQTPAAN